MASIRPHITSYRVVHLKTDKGKFYFPVYYIDQEIHPGDGFGIAPPEEEWKPLALARSTFWGPSGVTEFRSKNGIVTVHAVGSSYKFTIKDDEGNVLVNESNISPPPTDNCKSIDYLFLIGTNNVPFLGTAVWSNYPISPSTDLPVFYEPNTQDNFGYYIRPNLIAYVYGTFSDTGIALAEAILSHSSMYDSDPYEPGGISGTSDEEGTFDDTDDPNPFPITPSINTADTGFNRIYCPTLSQLRDLANYLWTDPSIWQTIKDAVTKYLDNPIDSFISLNMVPFGVPVSGAQEFKVVWIPTGKYLNVASEQFVTIDCGSVLVDKYWGSAVDYSPYTKIMLYLPYIGNVNLDTDEVMGKTLSLKYYIDIVSGACVACVAIDGSVRYQYSGHCGFQIPLTAHDSRQFVSAMIQAVRSVGSIAAAAAGAPELSGALGGFSVPEQKTSRTVETFTNRNPETGRQIKTGTVTTEHVSGTEASFSSIVAKNVGNTVDSVMGSKAVISRTGEFSGTTGFMATKRPFITKIVPRLANPENYGKYNGRPCAMYLRLGTCRGFTQLQQIRLEGISATNPELDEILSFLKSGVVL